MRIRKINIVLVALLLPVLCSAKKKEIAPEIVKLQEKIEWVMAKVDSQPDWLYSRLQMYWNSHATDVMINGETFVAPGEGRAPEPTVKYNGSRSMATLYNRPKLEDIVPYDDDKEGNVTFVSRATGKMEKTHPAKTGVNIAGLNRQIISIARDAALVYAATGNKRYGAMAAKVFDVYMKGIYYRDVPTDMNHGHQQTLVGMTTFEVIHEDVLNELTQMYPLIRDIVKDDADVIDASFKKWSENIISNGVPHNNWDLFQADFIVKIALVLQDDKHYADGKGKQYYLNYVVNENSIRQWGIKKLMNFGFDKYSKTWYESAGYSLTVMRTFSEFFNMLDQKAGIDLFSQCPMLKESYLTAVPQYLFPNRMFVGFGDSHPGYVGDAGINSVMEYAARHKNKTLLEEMNQLKNALTATASQEEIEKHVSSIYYAPNVSWLVMRTGMNRQHDLMASLNGSLGNHQHANGISLELYGKGYVLGPDAGIGRTLYSGLDYLEYYSQMPAHNTVVVDGVSSYPVMMSQHPFKVVASYPAVSDTVPSAPTLSKQKEKIVYSTVDFREPETNAQQRRTTVVVKTSDKGGFYVDVFRSRRSDGNDKTHDYFYHNLGQKMLVTDAADNAIAMQPTEELAFAGGHLYAYSYIYNKESAAMCGTVKTKFITRIEDERTVQAMDGQHEVTMTMWMKHEDNRTIIKALSPANLEYERMANQPYKIAEQPVLTFVARQYGEAWNHPFVAVYEPSSDSEPGDVVAVDFYETGEKGTVGVKVTLKDGTTQRILCREDGTVKSM